MAAVRGFANAPIVVVGASAGGIESVRTLLQNFPADLDAAVAVVIHRAPVEEDDRLARVLSRGSALPVTRARDGEPALAGKVYVAPAGAHLEMRGPRFSLSLAAKENGVRPSIDVLFRSAAAAYGSRAIGIILSGVLDDGTAGLAAIKAAGGRAIAQDPHEAVFGDMPRNAIINVDVDAVEPVASIGDVVRRLVNSMEADRIVIAARSAVPGTATRFSCPDCGGVLCEYIDNNLPRYVCRIGHAYSSAVLYSRQFDTLETTLWAAVRVFEERAELSTILAKRLRNRELVRPAQRLEAQGEMLLDRAARMREVMVTLAAHDAEMDANEQAVGA